MNIPTHIEEQTVSSPVTEVLAFLWARKWFIAGFTIIFALLGAAVAFLLPVKYQASTTLSIKTEQSQLNSLPSSVAGLSSLAGIKLGGTRDERESDIAALTARQNVTAFIAKENLLPVLFAENSSLLGGAPPTAWKATTYFMKNVLNVDEDQQTDLVAVTIDWKDPVTAAKWCNDYVEFVDRQLRNHVAQTSARSMAYLAAQSNDVTFANLRDSIGQLMEHEMRRAMMAAVADKFAFDVIDPAIAPEQKTSPQRAFILGVFTFLGFVFGIFVAFIRGPLKSVRERAAQIARDEAPVRTPATRKPGILGKFGFQSPP